MLCQRIRWTSHKGEFLAVVLPLSAGHFRKTPSPWPFGQQSQSHPHQCQIATKCGNEFDAICRLLLPSPEGFSHGHALLLVKTRILRPRSGRGLDAECPRHSPASRPWPCPVRDRVQSENSPCPRPNRVRNQSTTMSGPCRQTCPWSVHVRGRVQAVTVRIQPVSANYPCPCPVRIRAGFTSGSA
jgi:hypothetical protein